MANDRKSATSTLTARVSSAVGDELREAARARWDASADVFVWRARRCAEAVLYAVLHREGVDVEGLAKQRKGLDQLLEHKQIDGALSRDTRAQLTSLRDFGNIAAHYQLRGGVSSDSADAVARLLAGMLREFYAYERAQVPVELAGALNALTERSAREPTASEVELARVRRESDGLRARLNTPQATPIAPQRSRRSYLGVALAFALIGAALAVVVVRTQYDAAPAAMQAAVLDSAPTPNPVAPAPTPAVPAPAPSSVAVEAPTTPALGPQPPGMQRVDGQNGAGAFYIAHEPVHTGEYRACVLAHPATCLRPRSGLGCNWQNGGAADGNAANCLHWNDAQAYCAATYGASAGLPTGAEWRAAIARHAIARAGGTREWSGDASARGTRRVFAKPPSLDQSSVPEDAALRDLGFRCVVRAAP